ncbi:hypothetical protein GPECTOR_60g725 [Gonium pectorale]|uniref:Uncharacterized protein n=1 Tax=Gonium pectorale TaxID=33097 RepID=A0A150G545_GONPE|nr:hypothetical protein GPECTOR_60g725 [Gonium pectorale]|eukprot:KXZ44948.1 hypothetical protein GPECTOR_60g725 [Gonium pectorale]
MRRTDRCRWSNGEAPGGAARGATPPLPHPLGLGPRRFQEHDLEVASLAFSADDRLIATASCLKDAKLVVLDCATGKVVARQALEPGKRISACAWSPAVANGRSYTFATAAGDDLTLWTLDPFTGQLAGQKVVLGSVRREYSSLVFSLDGAWMLCGTNSGDVVAVNVQRRAVQTASPVCNGTVGALILSPDGPAPGGGVAAVAGGRDGSLSTFVLPPPGAAVGPPGASAWRELRAFALERSTNQLSLISSAQPAALTGAAFAAGQPEAVAASGADGSVAVWSTQDFTLQCRAQEPAQAGGALCCVLTQNTIISGWADGHIRCHGRAAGGGTAPPMWIIPGAHSLAHTIGVTAMRLANNGSFLLTGGVGGELRCWDMRSREMAAHMKLHADRITEVAVMADDKHVAAASEDRSWSLWDAGSEKVRTTWRTNTSLRGLAASPDKVSVVTVTTDRKIICWDVRSPEPRWTKVESHGTEAGCVASDNRGGAFATGGADCSVKVWDWQHGAEIAAGTVHTGPVTKVVFGPDDRSLVSVALDGSMAFWQLA